MLFWLLELIFRLGLLSPKYLLRLVDWTHRLTHTSLWYYVVELVKIAILLLLLVFIFLLLLITWALLVSMPFLILFFLLFSLELLTLILFSIFFMLWISLALILLIFKISINSSSMIDFNVLLLLTNLFYDYPIWLALSTFSVDIFQIKIRPLLSWFRNIVDFLLLVFIKYKWLYLGILFHWTNLSLTVMQVDTQKLLIYIIISIEISMKGEFNCREILVALTEAMAVIAVAIFILILFLLWLQLSLFFTELHSFFGPSFQ